MVNKKRCFVIMPFSGTNENHTTEYWARHFSSYLKPLIEAVKELEAFRSEPLRGNIASQIITDLTDSDIVVADLTDHNPNVLWELGVRQSFKHRTITIAEVGTKIPFHFSHKGILFYNGDHLDNEEFERQFKKSLIDCVKHPDEPDSPVIETLGGRGTLYSIVHKEENQRRLKTVRMEIARNEKLIKKIHRNCENNKPLRAEKKPTQMTDEYLGTSAAELLYVNRYLDLEEDFYVKLYNYFDFMVCYNRYLELWDTKSVHAEKMMVKDKEKIFESIKKVEKVLNKY